ncbi:uncharacterized protein [Solanum lycopersicum]|uniref:uncharacterized protein n=1 Tax=Solanum lycopersicum TaxID=4081 RepID=UPI0037498F3D
MGNPMAHFRAYYDQLVGVGGDEALLMQLFNRSLCGEALECFTSHATRQWPNWNALAKDFIDRFAYNIEIIPNRYSLEKMKQKSTESYREFAYRWRKEAARVRPPINEKEIIEVFVRMQEPKYYDRIMLIIGAKKIARVAASPGSSGLLRKKREEVAAISYGGRKTPRRSLYSQGCSRTSPKSYQACYTQSSHPNNQNAASIYSNVQAPVYQSLPLNYQSPSLIYPNHSPSYQIISPYQGVSPNCGNVQSSYRAPPPVHQIQAPLYQNSPPNYLDPSPNYQTNPYRRSQAPRPNTRSYQQVPPHQQGSYDPPQPRFEKRPSGNFTALAESRTKLYERLVTNGYIHPMGPKPMDVNSKFYKPDQRYAYHSNSVGHDNKDCINLKHKIQDLIDQEVVSLQPAAPNVKINPLSNHGGSNVNMIQTDKDWCGTKNITPIIHDDLERVVASLSFKEKREFVILTPAKAVALVPSETLAKPKFVI